MIPTKLYSHVNQVDKENELELEALRGMEMEYHAEDEVVGGDPLRTRERRKQLDRRRKETLKLKVGAQVVLTSNMNIDKGLVNGARGIVRGMRQKSVVVDFDFEGGEGVIIQVRKEQRVPL